MGTAMLILRVVVGLYVFGHGSQKLFGWFGGRGLKGTEGFMGTLGFRPPRLWAWTAALGETGGGLLLFLGLLNPAGPLLVIAVMLVAIFGAHWKNGIWNSNRGFELPLTNLAAALAVAVGGPGGFSLDAALGISLPEPVAALIGGLLVLLGVGWAFATRRPAPAPVQQPQAS